MDDGFLTMFGLAWLLAFGVAAAASIRHAFLKPSQELYQREVEAALDERYWAADWKSVGKRCNEEAPRCEDALQYERDLLGSHNTRVLIEASNKEMAIESRRDAAHRVDRERAANAGYEVMALFDRPVCRSYPNILGGWTTVCST